MRLIIALDGIFKRCIWLPLLLCTSCMSSKPPPRPLDLPFSFIYEGRFDDVWKATVSVLENYTITVANRDAGLLQTDWENQRFNPDLFEHPEVPVVLEEVRSRLKLKLSKAMMNSTGAPAVRLQISKEFEVFKNFFSDWERHPTDGYEEQVLLYRINQALKIIKAKKRKSLGTKPKKTAEKTEKAE